MRTTWDVLRDASLRKGHKESAVQSFDRNFWQKESKIRMVAAQRRSFSAGRADFPPNAQSVPLSRLRRFAPLKSLLPRLKKLYLYACKFDDLPPEICDEDKNKNLLHKVRAHYHVVRQIFISYAWGNISTNSTEDDRQSQEVVERLCRMLEQKSVGSSSKQRSP
jgi:hypothetical protein